MAGKIVRRSEDGSFSYSQSGVEIKDLQRIEKMYDKAN